MYYVLVATYISTYPQSFISLYSASCTQDACIRCNIALVVAGAWMIRTQDHDDEVISAPHYVLVAIYVLISTHLHSMYSAPCTQDACIRCNIAL